MRSNDATAPVQRTTLSDAHRAKLSDSLRAYYADPAHRQEASERTKRGIVRKQAREQAELDALRAEVERLRGAK